MILLVYVVVAYSLYRLWSSPPTVLWWVILGAAILTACTAEAARVTARDAVEKAAERMVKKARKKAAVARANPGQFLLGNVHRQRGVVRFCKFLSMLFAALTVVLSVAGVILSSR